jgi:hypothetical protein
MAAALLCSACSSSPSLGTESQKFLAVENNTNKALTQDTKQLKSQLSQLNAAYAVAFVNAADQIRALQFPSYLNDKVNRLVNDLHTMARQAEAVAVAAGKDQSVQANVVAYANLDLKLMEEETAEKKDSNDLRRSVGLPIETTTTAPSQPLGTSPSPPRTSAS